MANEQVHLSDNDLMLLLQGIKNHDGFIGSLVNSVRSKLLKKEQNVQQAHSEHLLDCPECFYHLWDAYVSLDTILTIAKTSVRPKLRLNFDDLRSSFQAQLNEGFLLLNYCVPVASVRSEQETTSSLNYYTHAEYLLLIPKADNMLINFTIVSTVSGIKFEIYFKNCSDSFLCSFSHNGDLRESQNISTHEQRAHFFLHYDDSNVQAELTFALQKENTTEEPYEFITIVL